MAAAPHPTFTEDPQGLRYEEGRVFSVAAIILPFCLVFLGFGLAFLSEVVNWPWHMGTAMAILTVMAFLAFGLMAGLLSLAAIRPQRLVFDATARRLRGQARGRFWLLSAVDIGFDALHSPDVRRTPHESGPDTFDIRITRAGGFDLCLGAYENRAEADHWQARIAAMIAQTD
jgi:hypothetical protein